MPLLDKILIGTLIAVAVGGAILVYHNEANVVPPLEQQCLERNSTQATIRYFGHVCVDNRDGTIRAIID